MQNYFQLTLTLGIVAHTCTGPVTRKVARSSAAEHYGFNPIFGRLTPSQDIRDFVASVFRQGSEEDEPTAPQNTATTLESGENLRPTDMNIHAHVGYDLYWPGGEWVVRKAEIARCNTSDAACSPIFKDYGPVCAGDNRLSAHHTFENICEMDDTNCRDGTASMILQSQNPSDIRWFPVKRHSGIHLKISSRNTITFVLARGKDVKMQPQAIIKYGYLWNGDSRAGAVYKNLQTSLNEWRQEDYEYCPQCDDLDAVCDFDVYWNETEGSVKWTLTLPDDKRGRVLKKAVDTKLFSFPYRYLGVFGGNLSDASWIEVSGLPRGYMLAYRGECREDMPPLPTEVPKNISGRHKIQLFNFAERLDEFGYNLTRVPGPTVYDYGGDYYFDYPAQP